MTAGAAALENAGRLARRGLFLDAILLLGEECGARWEGEMDFNVAFDFDRIFLLDGQDKPTCDAAGLASARAILRRVEELFGENRLTLVLRGAVETCAARYDEALEILERAESRDPGDPWVHLWKFRARSHADFMGGPTLRMQESLAHVDRAIELDPDNPHAFAWRARARRNLPQSFVPLALRDIDRVIEILPRYLWAIGFRANLHANLGDKKRSLDNCAAFESLCPDKPCVWASLGRIKARLGLLDESLHDLDRAIAMDPGGSMLYAWRGEVKRLLGLQAEAANDFWRSHELKPRYILNLLWIARIRMLEGDFRFAAECLDQVVREAPYNERAYAYRWQCRLWLGQFEGALEDYHRVSHRTSDDLWMPQIADAAARRSTLQTMLDRFPADPWAYVWRGRILASARTADLDAARADFDRALSLAPDQPWAHLWKGEILYQMGRSKDAAAHFERSFRLTPSVRSQSWLARVRLDEGKVEAALSFLQTAVSSAPDDNELRLMLGEALTRSERYEEAFAELTEIRLQISGRPEGFYWRAQACASSGRLSEALVLVDRALELRAGQYPPAHVLKARILRAAGKLEEARAELLAARTPPPQG